ncbi:MAG: S8 family peptidase [Gemmataceae bacterium]
MIFSRLSQRRLATLPVRARKAHLDVEALERRDLPSVSHFLGSLIRPLTQSATQASASQMATGQASIAGSPVTPTNPMYGYQWDMSEIGAPYAWSNYTGNNRTTVAVIDTGIDYNHWDLYGNIWINQAEIPWSRRGYFKDMDGDGLITFRDLNYSINQGYGKITDINGDGHIDAQDILAPMGKNAQGRDSGWGGWASGSTQDGDTQHPDDLVGWNFVANNNRPFDDNGHGTHVAGTIGAMGDSGVGVAGIDWHVQMMALKFMDANGNGSYQQAADAINYSIRHGAQISNNSWDGTGFYLPLAQAIANSQSAGQIFVVAAGNSGQSLWLNGAFPADLTFGNMVRVAATDQSRNLASSSNYGYGLVQLAAPGVNILSTTPNNSYGWYSGTSMATPHVTGVLALLHDVHPYWSYQQLIATVVDSTTPSYGLLYKTTSMGELNAPATLAH